MPKKSSEHMVRLYAASSLFLNDGSVFENALKQVPACRRAKVAAYRFRSDKMLSLAAGLLLRHAVEREGFDYNSLHCAVAENGKPYFTDCPLCFNLSHSGDYALCAVSDAEVGCDIEKTGDIDLAVAKRFFAPAEYDDVMAQKSDDGRKERFYRYWTLKESFMKATGLGMKLPLSSFCIRLGDVVSVSHSVNGEPYGFFESDSLPGYRIAACVDSRELRAVELEVVALCGKPFLD